MGEQVQVDTGVRRIRAARLLTYLTPRNIVIGALPVVILAGSPDRVAISLVITAVYVGVALWIARDWRANQGVLLYAGAAALFMALSFLRMDFLDGLNAAQRTYGSSKAFYFIAVLMPLSAAVAMLVPDAKAIKPAVVVQMAIGIVVAVLAVTLRSGTVLGESRYAWEGNLIGLGFVLACQFWLIRDIRILAAIGAVSIAGIMFAGARQSLVMTAVGLLATAGFWLAVRIRDHGPALRSALSTGRVLLPVAGLVTLGAAILLTYFVFGPITRNAKGDVQNPCHCVTYRVAEIFSDPGGHDVLLKDGIRMFARDPVVGSGLGSFVGQVKGYNYPHSIVLEVGDEMGIVGLAILFVPLLVGALLLIRRAYRERDPATTSVLALALCYFVIANLSGDVPSARPFWIFAFVVLKLALQRPAETVRA